MPYSNPMPIGLGYYTQTDLGVTTLSFNQTESVNGFTFLDFTDLTALTFPNLVSVDPANVIGGGVNVGANNLPAVASFVSFAAPALTTIGGPFTINGCSNFTTLSLPALATVGQQFTITACNALTSVSLPALVSCTTGLEIANSSGLTNINVPALTTLGGLTIFHNTSLTSVSLPILKNCGSISITANTSLVNLSLPDYVPVNGQDDSFHGNALNAASVNVILALYVNTASFRSGDIDLAGGTNAAPTGAGATAVTTLRARGCTVEHN